MKTVRFILTTMMLALASNMFGDELEIQDFTIMPGETKNVSIELNNPDNPYILLEFEVVFPEGISIAKDEDDEFLVELNSSRIAKSHTLEVADHGGGIYKFLAYSSKNAAFKGTAGEIISMTLKAADNATDGQSQGKITGQLFSKQDETGYYPDDKTFNVTIKGEEESVTVTAKDYTRKYGEGNPTFEFITEGGTLEGVPKITCEATETSPVGTYPIAVSKGTITNGKVTYVAGTLTIEKAPLKISGGSYTMKQGDALPELMAIYEGFKNGETEEVLTTKPTLSTTATSSSEPGDYEVTVSGAVAQNYEITYENGKITVSQADAITVTAKSYTIKYGDELPTFEYTSEGATLQGTPTITSEATSASPVGTYDIIISKGSVSNYNVTYVKGTLTIEKAPLTISGGTYSMKQGDAVPALKAEYEGFKNGEDESVLTKKPELKTTATSASEPGEYEVTVSSAEARNYSMSYKPGKITVTQADAVIVSAKSYTIKYGDAIPEFGYDVEGAELQGTPEISCEATATSAVGTYDIIVSKGSVTNYNVSYVKGTLTIEKAPLKIKGGSYTMKQGEAVPELKAEYEGFKNGEDESVLTKKPELKTTATSASEPGEYEVTVSGAEAQNYEIAYEVGIITVTMTDGIEAIVTDGKPFNIYSVQGKLVRRNARDFMGLPKGIYIVNKKKIVLK